MVVPNKVTIHTALTHGRTRLSATETALLDAELLLAHALNTDRLFLKKSPEYLLSASVWQTYQTLLQERQAGRPIAYLLGTKSFWQFELTVTPDVLIPRPETECLVEAVLRVLPKSLLKSLAHSVLELGTGSGAIALALAYERPDANIIATDVSLAALAVAKDNAVKVDLQIQFVHSDWFEQLKDQGPFLVIVSNPPYIAADDPHLITPTTLQYEPYGALCSGATGLEALTTIIEQAKAYLIPGGWLCLEHGHDQQEKLLSLLHENGYHKAEGFSDFANIPRVVIGKL